MKIRSQHFNTHTKKINSEFSINRSLRISLTARKTRRDKIPDLLNPSPEKKSLSLLDPDTAGGTKPVPKGGFLSLLSPAVDFTRS